MQVIAMQVNHPGIATGDRTKKQPTRLEHPFDFGQCVINIVDIEVLENIEACHEHEKFVIEGQRL